MENTPFMCSLKLNSGRTCFMNIIKGRQRDVLDICISHSYAKPVSIEMRTSMEFIDRIETVLSSSIKVFVGLNDDSTKVTFRIQKGMCKVSTKIYVGTKVILKIPVDDDFSWGKATITLGELKKINSEICDMKTENELVD